MKKSQSFRNFFNVRDEVKNLYKQQRIHQCPCYVKRMHSKYLPSSQNCKNIITMSCWDALNTLTNLVDKSDPDTTLPNIQHAFQTAESMRECGLPDWMQLAGLIHDLGKILYIKGCKEDGTDIDTQYGVVGDTYPLEGYVNKNTNSNIFIPLSNSLVFPEFNSLSSCKCMNASNEECINERNIGFENCLFTFGHDEYLWQVLKHNSKHPFSRLRFSDDLPWEFMYFIRFHSFYAWHKHESYENIADEFDKMALNKLREFSSFDLYSKCKKYYNINVLKDYYNSIIIKYLGCSLDDGLQW